MEKELKKHLDIRDQLARLKSRGLIVEDECFAEDILDKINYYRLSGYLHDFKESNTDCYYKGLSFNQIYSIYKFDSKLTRILLFALENVEETFKSRFSYTLSKNFPEDPLIYLNSNIYKDTNKQLKFCTIFDDSIEKNKNLPFIKHHINNYEKKLPIWVAVEIMTLGNMFNLYSNLQTNYQKQIAKKYNTGIKQINSWLCNLSYTRNHLAHYMRIYNYNFGRTPMSCNKHGQISQTGKIYDQIIAIGFLYSNNNERKNYIVKEISALLNEYKDVIKLEGIGFPFNWEEELTSINN